MRFHRLRGLSQASRYAILPNCRLAFAVFRHPFYLPLVGQGPRSPRSRPAHATPSGTLSMYYALLGASSLSKLAPNAPPPPHLLRKGGD